MLRPMQWICLALIIVALVLVLLRRPGPLAWFFLIGGIVWWIISVLTRRK